MPTKTAKKPTKKTAKPKAPAKKAARKVKPKAKKVAAAPPAKSGFMWKLLEKKEQERKRRDESRANPAASHAYGAGENGGHDYSRFNGPRRKAA